MKTQQLKIALDSKSPDYIQLQKTTYDKNTLETIIGFLINNNQNQLLSSYQSLYMQQYLDTYKEYQIAYHQFINKVINPLCILHNIPINHDWKLDFELQQVIFSFKTEG